MLKKDLIDLVSKESHIMPSQVETVIDGVVAAIYKELAAGGTVKITGFGTFSVTKRIARMGVNPRNLSEKIQIPASNTPKFKAGTIFKESVRSKNEQAA